MIIDNRFFNFVYQELWSEIIDKLAFFDLPIKTEQEAYEKNYRY